MFFLFVICIGWIVISPCHAQTFEFRHIARGADTAEIYITCYWYSDDTTAWGAIFHSIDNGQSFSVQNKYLFPIGETEIFGDSLPGVIFQTPYGAGIGVSYDYGVTFEDKYSPLIHNVVHVGGSQKGEFYLEGGINVGEEFLYHFTHFGDSLYLMNNDIDSLRILDSGSLPGELYAFQAPYVELNDTIKLAFSNDFGQTFTINYLDTSIIANLFKHTLSHGPAAGELYMAGTDATLHYHIFHSLDYGHTFELKYITDQFHWGWDQFSFVAGRAPGTFYIFEQCLCSNTPIHNCIKIHFSRDYGASYTTYFHEFDSTYTGIIVNPQIGNDFIIFPNPATDKVRVQLGMRNDGLGMNEELRIFVFDIFGREVKKIPVPEGKDEILLDVSGWTKGIYILTLKAGERVVGRKKVMVAG